jgi:hypothetical protein
VRPKPRVYKHGRNWDCEIEQRNRDVAVWQFETWWQAFTCALVLASGQIPWMLPWKIYQKRKAQC